MKTKFTAAILAGALALSACENMTQQQGEQAMGATAGAIGGAVLAQLLGANAGWTAAGALACPPPRPRAADPMSYAMDRMAPVCRAAGVAFSAAEGFIDRADIDGDGAPDAVVDWGKAGCSSAGTFCTGEFCDLTFLYNIGEGGFVPGLTIRAKGYQVAPILDIMTDLEIIVPSSACGYEETGECAAIYHSRPGGDVELVGYF
ncbi:hypothetical protein [Mangrovicoccus ximenensis]|uniref:hypothetical protein n=1 Tax=Mangrovicoccus ximenensis TaxID=1911570 RepID=UPI000D3A8E87|nr:hypothetical protein [Mangrovicoccus ximenensis]